MSPPRKYLVKPGDQFGRLTVIREIRLPGTANPDRIERGAACRCSCGGSALVQLVKLFSGHTSSCGCLLREHMIRLGLDIRPKLTHGLSKHPLYHTYKAMMSRCYNEQDKAYEYYGGRGIRVCARWHTLSLFVQDIEQELGPRPRGRTLDRINNAGNYEPGDVRWATFSEQARNRRMPRKRGPDGTFITTPG